MLSPSNSRTPRDRRNLRWIAIVQFVWLACLVANGDTFQRHFPAPIAMLVALLPLAVGAVVIWTYVRFVRQADDLQKAIQLGGLAVGFGVCVVFTLAYPPLEQLGLPPLQPNHFAAVGVLAYMLATAIYSIRYE